MPFRIGADEEEHVNGRVGDGILDDLFDADIFRFRLADDAEILRPHAGQFLGKRSARQSAHGNTAVPILAQEKVLTCDRGPRDSRRLNLAD